MEKDPVKFREGIQTKPIEVTSPSSDVADEELFLFTKTADENETQEQTLERKQQSRFNAADWVASDEPSFMKPSTKEFTKIDGNTASYSFNRIKTYERIRVEQGVYLVLKDLQVKFSASHMKEYYYKLTEESKTRTQMKTVSTSKMDRYFGKTTEKLVVLKITNFSYQSNFLMKYSGAWIENLGKIPELPRH